MKVKSESEVALSCPTLSDPMDCSLPGSSTHGIFQARVLDWGAIAVSGIDIHISTIDTMYKIDRGFPGGSVVKNLPAKQETRVTSLAREDPLEKEMAAHSSALAWRIPWMEGPGGLQSMRSQRVRHD